MNAAVVYHLSIQDVTKQDKITFLEYCLYEYIEPFLSNIYFAFLRTSFRIWFYIYNAGKRYNYRDLNIVIAMQITLEDVLAPKFKQSTKPRQLKEY